MGLWRTRGSMKGCNRISWTAWTASSARQWCARYVASVFFVVYSKEFSCSCCYVCMQQDGSTRCDLQQTSWRNIRRLYFIEKRRILALLLGQTCLVVTRVGTRCPCTSGTTSNHESGRRDIIQRGCRTVSMGRRILPTANYPVLSVRGFLLRLIDLSYMFTLVCVILCR